MCTLTYIPTGKNTFIWTHNRDESPLRTSPGLNTTHENYVFPQEPLSGGTWIGISKKNRVISLLNGAFEQTKYVPSSKRSRGLIVLDFFEFENPIETFQQYDLEDIEPFTMVVYDKGNLIDFRWDKTKKYVKQLDPQKHYIWSSAILYAEEVRFQRQVWFEEYLLTHKIYTRKNILRFHQNTGIDDKENGLIMDRGIVKTVSITSIEKAENELDMLYYDLVNGGESQCSLSIL